MSSKLVSTDSHVIEPPDIWTTRVPAKYRDRAPQIVSQNGADWWTVDGIRLGFVSGPRRHDSGASGSLPPVSRFSEVRESAYTPDDYVKENLDDGVVGSVVSPSYGLMMYGVQDRELLSAICRAYNDWMAGFCAADPAHLTGVAMINNFIVEDAVAEMERARDRGLTAAMISIWPGTEHSYKRPECEPIWTAAERLGMPLCLHAHSNHDGPYGVPLGQPSTPSRRANADFWIRMALGDMIFGGVFERHPELKVISLENEGGWVPYFLSQIDWVYWERMRPQGRAPKPGTIPRPPSAYFRENVFVSIIHDRALVEARYIAGVNNILWGSDYPHDQCTYPESKAAVASLLAGVPDHEAACIGFHTAADLFGLNVARPAAAKAVAVSA